MRLPATCSPSSAPHMDARAAAIGKPIALRARRNGAGAAVVTGGTAPDAGSPAPKTCAEAGTDFAAYLGGLAAHGHVDLHVELQEAKHQVADHGGYYTLTKALGIPRTAIVDAGGLGLLRITTEGRYFTPATDEDQRNRLSLIVPVWDGLGGNLVDLLSIRLDRPTKFCVRSGFARCLGAWNADAIRDETTLWEMPGDVHPSLVLAPNPLLWLRGDCAGACILHKAWLSHTLVGIKSVVAHNKHHAAALHKLFVWPEAPKIYLHANREAA